MVTLPIERDILVALHSFDCFTRADGRAGSGLVTPRPEPIPPKIRELIAQLEQLGFENRGGKGSHRNFVHPGLSKRITVSGKLGDDAKQYQIRAVRNAIVELQK